MLSRRYRAHRAAATDAVLSFMAGAVLDDRKTASSDVCCKVPFRQPYLPALKESNHMTADRIFASAYAKHTREPALQKKMYFVL